ncbi:hypothetical protein HPB51_003167 [Rhipicephalus microplus]|uniref:Uncharacterized protein n=1 Tax=Rhipicephalus microplus TaxID=6941 RepID=A0A9J6ELE3_RHIMP|nr:hypothetical protein HPB51_003167 [Rhipicephalus microplus]
MDIEAVLGIAKTPEQCENRYKTVIRRRKASSDHNKRSGASPTPVPFDDEVKKIESIDDSIEPEVERDASGATFKASPESPAVLSPANTTEENKTQSSNPDTKPRVGTARLARMQLFFTEMRALQEEKEAQKAARRQEKENRRAERQAERQDTVTLYKHRDERPRVIVEAAQMAREQVPCISKPSVALSEKELGFLEGFGARM